MLVLKRILTSAVLFVTLFVLCYFGIIIVGAGIAGGIAGSKARSTGDFQKDYQAGADLGSQAGAEFATKNAGIIALGSLVISAVASLGLSFGGVFPWCRRATEPPEGPPPLPH